MFLPAVGRLLGTGVGVDICVGAGVDVFIGVAAHLDHGLMVKGTCHFCHTCGLFQFRPYIFLS